MTKRQLTTALKLMRETQRHIKPDGAWVLRTRHELLKTVRREAMRRPISSTKERFKALILAFVPRTTVDLIRGPVMAALSVIGMVLGGSLASVSAAERSIPGDILYPVKLAAEQARLLMETEQPKKLQLKTEFVGRRAEEMKKIVTTVDVTKRSERIREAADIMKKNLDTVKTELHVVSMQEGSVQAVEVAKSVDKVSGQVNQAVKDVRDLVPEDAKVDMTEVQTAAVTTSVKAVQIMIEKSEDPGVKAIVSTDELKRSVEEKVLGLEEGIADATQKVANVKQASIDAGQDPTPVALGAPTTTGSELLRTLQAPIDQLKAAKESLETTKQSLEKQDLQQVKEALGEAVKAISAAEKGIAALVPEPKPLEGAGTTLVTPTSTMVTPSSSAVTVSSTAVHVTTTQTGTSSSTSASADGR